MLIPSRTDTSYWHDYIFNRAEIEFLRGRLKFEVDGVSGDSAPFPSALIIYKGDDKMSDRAQRVLDALMEYDADNKFEYPIKAISEFFVFGMLDLNLDEDYDLLTVDEEKQVIKAFLEFAY